MPQPGNFLALQKPFLEKNMRKTRIIVLATLMSAAAMGYIIYTAIPHPQLGPTECILGLVGVGILFSIFYFRNRQKRRSVQ